MNNSLVNNKCPNFLLNSIHNAILYITISLIALIIVLFSTKSFISYSLADPIVFKKNFSHWSVYYELKSNGKKLYYAVSTPIQTKVYNGIRDEAYMAITYVNPTEYTISVYFGFIVDSKKPLSLNTANSTYTLPVIQDEFAYTYNSSDDINILNDLVTSSNTLIEIRSYDISAGLAVDYYAPTGLKEALLYIQKSKYSSI